MRAPRLLPTALLTFLFITLSVATNAQTVVATVPAGSAPFSVAVNPVTNKTYVANVDSNNVTVIDGATLSTSTVAVGNTPSPLVVNSVTNKIYVVNSCGNDPQCGSGGTVTVIDGVSLSTTSVPVGQYPNAWQSIR
jgi:YVTN family beta-propeller protein